MKYLTAEYIRAAVAKDPRFDPDIAWDERGKAIVYLADGYTWYALDGNRSVEGFIISKDNSDGWPRDTVAYWKSQVANITPIVKYQIHGRDEMMMEDYIKPELYDTYKAAFADAHSNREWVVKV
jgi:hypothetical protein